MFHSIATDPVQQRPERPPLPTDSRADQCADRILRAIDHPTIDHRGPEFGALGRKVLSEIKTVVKTGQDVVIYPASGTGAWEAPLVNTLSAGDRLLMFETGHFASLWRDLAERLDLQVDFVAGDWRHGVDPAAVEARLAEDPAHAIKAVMVVHNETSTSVTSRIGAIRQAIDAAGHPMLFMVDMISSLASIDYPTMNGASTSPWPAHRRV